MYNRMSCAAIQLNEGKATGILFEETIRSSRDSHPMQSILLLLERYPSKVHCSASVSRWCNFIFQEGFPHAGTLDKDRQQVAALGRTGPDANYAFKGRPVTLP